MEVTRGRRRLETWPSRDLRYIAAVSSGGTRRFASATLDAPVKGEWHSDGLVRKGPATESRHAEIVSSRYDLTWFLAEAS